MGGPSKLGRFREGPRLRRRGCAGPQRNRRMVSSPRGRHANRSDRRSSVALPRTGPPWSDPNPDPTATGPPRPLPILCRFEPTIVGSKRHKTVQRAFGSVARRPSPRAVLAESRPDSAGSGPRTASRAPDRGAGPKVFTTPAFLVASPLAGKHRQSGPPGSRAVSPIRPAARCAFPGIRARECCDWPSDFHPGTIHAPKLRCLTSRSLRASGYDTLRRRAPRATPAVSRNARSEPIPV